MASLKNLPNVDTAAIAEAIVLGWKMIALAIASHDMGETSIKQTANNLKEEVKAVLDKSPLKK